MLLDEVVARMHAGEFKPNCALGALFPTLSACASGMTSNHISQIKSPYRFYGAPWPLDTGE